MFVRERKAKTKKEGVVEYVYLVENKWNPVKKKHEQKIIASLGRKDKIQDTKVLDKIILALKTFSLKQKIATQSFVINNLKNEEVLSSSKDYGVYWLTEKLLTKLSFDKIIKSAADRDKGKKISLKNILPALTTLLSHRLTNNQDKLSELASFNWFNKNLFLPQRIKGKTRLKKDYLYRTLDFLINNKDRIEKEYYEKNKNLFNQELDLVLFDTTSIYYWGEKGEAAQKTKASYRDLLNTDLPEALLKYSGNSKEKRTDLKQLMVGVLMAEDLQGNAVPVAHETFPGNQSDFVSFPKVIEKVKKKYKQYKIGRIIFVADKGMTSEENMRSLEEQKSKEKKENGMENGMEYVLGVRIRKLHPLLKKALILNTGTLDDKEYLDSMKKIKDNLYAKEFKMTDFLKTGPIWPHPNPGKKNKNKKINGKQAINEIVNNIYKNLDFYKSRTGDEKKDKKDIKRRVLKRRYFICFNPFVAQDKKEKRKFFKKIIKNKIKYQQNKKWIVKNGYKKYLKIGKLDLKLNKEKLNQEQYYDGKWILITNNQTMSPNLATIRYKSLRFVEQGFKDLKSLIKIRPIFHSKEERIKAHVFTAFLVLILKWYVYQKLDSISQKPGRRFLKAINKIKAIEVDKESQIWVRTEIDKQTLNNFKTLKIAPPQKLLLDRRKYIKPKKKKQIKTKKHGVRNLTLPLF